MILVSKDGKEKLQGPDYIIGASAESYIGYDWYTHTFHTYSKQYWDVKDYGLPFGTEIKFTIDPIY